MGATRSVHSGSCNLKWICVSDACQLISVSDSYLLKGPKQQKRDTINSIRGHGSKATQVMNSDLIGGHRCLELYTFTVLHLICIIKLKLRWGTCID